MKTVQVEDLTWKTLQEMKLAWGLSTLNAVIDRLILSSVHKESTTVEAKHMSPEMPDANISAEMGSGNRSRRNSDGSLDNSCVEKEKGEQK